MADWPAPQLVDARSPPGRKLMDQQGQDGGRGWGESAFGWLVAE
ncbi:MAG: hypothetical protein Q8P67_23130 [archaeon]|nr:hypothetical protein [archaeon]